MKKTIAATLTLALLLTCLGASALAAPGVYINGTANLRSGPDRSCAVTGTANAGDILDYLGESAADERGVEWYHVDTDSGEGWVSSRCGTLSDSGDTVRAIEDVNVRSAPNLLGRIVGTLFTGRTDPYLDATACDSDGIRWYRIHHNGQTGWVCADYVELY